MISIQEFPASQLWQGACGIVVNRLKKCGREGKRSLLLLSGGSTVNICQRLAEYIDKIQIRSDNLAVGQVDERFQPGINDQINAVAIEKSGMVEKLGRLAIPFYRIPQSGTLREAAYAYDKLLKKLFDKFNFHMAILGLGTDGHTAGLLRGYRNEWDMNRLVVGYENRGKFKQRISITARVFGMLDYAVLAISGEEKKKMAEKIISKGSEDINNLPGILIRKIKEVDVVRVLPPPVISNSHLL